jgi:Cu+-exporting ATPase
MFRKLLFVAFAGMLLVSCGKSTTKNEKVTSNLEKSENLAVNLEKVAINIEGMTCEIGCARTIQSKLSKTEGVITASVSFDEKQGIVEYDASKINAKKIAAIVQEIAGGDLYKVTGTKSLEIATD